MDAAIPADAQNVAHRDLEISHRTRDSHSAHTRIIVVVNERKRQRRLKQRS